MRYIRTEDGIYEIQWFESDDCFREKKNHEVVSFELEDRQADSVDELCDEFIVVHENGTHVIQKRCGHGLKDMDKNYPEYLKRNNQVFYGAIWTDKGLIYIAKMNENGELELL